MHIPPFDNQNKPIVDIDDANVPLNYFNIVKLSKGQAFSYSVPGYETCIVPATGSVNVDVEGERYADLGTRTANVWDGEPEGVYVPSGAKATFNCVSDPRKIKHILGTKYHDKVGRLLVSELFTVGQGGWSGFPPHKHDTDRLPDETRHDETYNFRFRPDHGFGLQLVQREDGKVGDAYHLVESSTITLEKGYHPCVAAPGYEMYYFTILGGLSQRSLVQYFQPDHAYQIETIPGIKDMIAKFK